MKILGTFWAIVRGDGVLDLRDGEPMIFANKGPHADSNAAHRGCSVERVAVMHEDELCHMTSLDVRMREGEPVQIDATFAGEAMRMFAAHMAEYFRREGGKNFIVLDMSDPNTGDRFQITMQRAGGETPAVKIAKLQATLRKIRDTCGDSDPAGGTRAADLARSVLS
jgi:hypothetical protein